MLQSSPSWMFAEVLAACLITGIRKGDFRFIFADLFSLTKISLKQNFTLSKMYMTLSRHDYNTFAVRVNLLFWNDKVSMLQCLAFSLSLSTFNRYFCERNGLHWNIFAVFFCFISALWLNSLFFVSSSKTTNLNRLST